MADRVHEFLLSFLVHSLVHEELLRDILEEDDRMVIVAFVLASVVDTVHQADILLFGNFDVDHIFQNLQRIWLRELLQDERRLLLILTKHFAHQAAAYDADQRF